MNQSTDLWDDLKERVQFADEMIVGVKTMDGNYVITTTRKISNETLKMINQLIKEEIGTSNEKEN